MDDNRIEIVASLNYKVSEASIVGDLQKIQDTFNDKGGLQIKCQISDADLKNIQTQLSNITRGLNVDVGTTGVNAVQQSMKQTSSAVNNANQQVQQLSNSLANLSKRYTQLTGKNNLVNVFANATNTVDEQKTVEAIHKLYSELGEVETKVHTIGTRFSDVDVKIKSSTGEVRTLNLALKDIEKPLQGFSVSNTTWSDSGIRKQTEEISKFIDTYTTKLNSLKAKAGENFAPNISATIGEDINKTIVTFDSFEKKLAELKSGKGSIEELRAEFVTLDGTVSNLGSLLRGGDSSLNQFTNATIKARNFANDLKALEVEFENLSTITKGDKLFSSLAEAEQKLVALQNIQKNEGYTENWIKQYQELSVAIKQVTEDIKLAKKLEQQDASSALQIYNKELNTIKRSYSEIASKWQPKITSLNSTDTDAAIAQVHRDQLLELIRASRQRLETEGLIDQKILDEIAHGEQLVDEAKASAKAENERAEVKKREAEARKQEKQDLQDVNKLIKDNLTALEKFNNSTVVKNNKSNANVMGQVGINTDLITQLKAWQDSLKSDSSATNVAKVKSEIEGLSAKLGEAKNNSEALQQSLANTSAEATLEAKIKTLTSQMNIFAEANQRAIESTKKMRGSTLSFAETWDKMMSSLASGNLDAESLKRLTEQFRVFKNEAQEMGLKTSSIFDKMGGQLKMLASRWLSIYAVVGYIRKMIDNIKELDAAMINLRRVTDETDESYSRFLKNAMSVAREMKTTASSLTEQAYQWAKLGYSMNDALELAQSSTIYMKVADVGQDQALSNLVTTLKAFNLEADDTIEVVDKLDKLNNKYAVSASGLGQGLERSASAMAMTGNTLEQTLAMLTGAGEITQSLEETGKLLPLENYIG